MFNLFFVVDRIEKFDKASIVVHRNRQHISYVIFKIYLDIILARKET